jgi:DNA adenine methylase
MPENIRAAAERLKEVQIENRPALELIRRFRHENVLIYADPPYLLETRSGKQYRHEMTDADHEALLAALKAHPGPVILSGYHSPMYDSELHGWNIIERKAYNQNGNRRTEVLWCNYEIPTLI